MLLGALAEDGAQNSGILGLGGIDGPLQALWQVLGRGAGIPQRSRRMADILAEEGLVAIKRALRDAEIGLRCGEAGLRLRDIRARHFADLETVLGRAQLLGKHFNGVLAQPHNRGVANDIHVGRRRVQQHVNLGAAEILAGGFHQRLGAFDVVVGAEAVEQRLLQLDLPHPGIGRAV